jgi:WD40 repeat protein
VVLGAVVVALAVSIALALLALLQRNRAIDQRDNATSRGVALHALAEMDAGDFDRGVLLSLEALRTKPTFEARSTAIAAMGRSDRAEALLRSPSRASFSAVAISPDGRFVAAGGSDRAIHVWDRKTRRHYGKPLRLPRLDEPVSLTFGPQGQQLVAGYNGSNTTIWLLSPSGARAVPLRDAPGRSGYVPSAAVSPD